MNFGDLMETPSKQVSNSFSTGGGGHHFEAQVLAMFITLMLAEGVAPIVPAWPIQEIGFQNRIRGYCTDDLVVVARERNGDRTAKLIAQIKHTISITASGKPFGDVLRDAWSDYTNSKLFDRSVDRIALITGPLSATDTNDVSWLLNQARHTGDFEEFYTKVNQTNFSSTPKRQKLEAFRSHLSVTDEELHAFLRHFHLLICDLGNDAGTMLHLLHSLMLQFRVMDPASIWGRIVDLAQTWNQDAGIITLDDLPEDLKATFTRKERTIMPSEFRMAEDSDLESGELQVVHRPVLLVANLLGGWDESKEADLRIVERVARGSRR